MEKISVLLVDDHKLIRDAWAFVLENDSRLELAGQTADAEEALAIVHHHQPHVALVDINMSPVDGFELTGRIIKTSRTKVVCVSMYGLPVYAKKMFQIGAMGYVTKNSPIDELLRAIIEVNHGNKYVCSEIKNMLALERLAGNPPDDSAGHLSKRELEITVLIKQGLSSKEIAAELAISLKTVEVHRYHILKKLKLKNTAALVNYIHEHGL
ncbi:MAG: response regulator transcription factor [Bacteroidota bacterium]|nr:response regulator transcription factor [Bacteroidota bacterium]